MRMRLTDGVQGRADEGYDLEDQLLVALVEVDVAGTIGGSAEPFDQWFRDHVQDVHGISLADGMPIPELILDFDSDV